MIQSAPVTVRAAITADVQWLLVMAGEFTAESDHGWTLHEKIAASTLRAAIESDDADVLIPFLDGEPAGLAVVACGRDYVAERIGYLEKFYIRRRARGTPVARTLMDEVARWFDAHWCWASFATATAGVGADAAFVNLARRYGFEPRGPTLERAAYGGDRRG